MKIKKWRFSGFALGILLIVFFFSPFLPLSAEESTEKVVTEVTEEPRLNAVPETENPPVSVAASDEEIASSAITENAVDNRSPLELNSEKSVFLSHVYHIVEEVAATCESPGYIVYLCDYCDKSYQEEIPISDHDYYISDQKNADCEHDGFITYQCSHCNNSYTEILPALGHDFHVYEEVEAGCEQEGYIISICSHCKEKKTVYLPAKGHIYEEVGQTPPTESADGCVEYICSRCQNKMIEPLPATGNEANSAESDNLSVPAAEEPSKPPSQPTISSQPTGKTVSMNSPGDNDESPAAAVVAEKSVADASPSMSPENKRGGTFNMLSIALLLLILAVAGSGAGYVLSYRTLFQWAAQKEAAAIQRFAKGGVL